MIFPVALATIALTELAARLFERRTQRNTRVSTNPATDHKMVISAEYGRLGGLATVVLSTVIAALGGAPTMITLILVFAFALYRIALVLVDQTAANVSSMVRVAQALKKADFDHAPIALFFSAVDLQKPDHVNAWADELDKVGVPWFVVVAERHHLTYLRDEGKHKAVFLADLAMGAQLLPKSLKALLYVNNAQKNRTMIRALQQLLHVQLLHGDSDKPPSYSPLTKNYDQVFVAGKMAIDRYMRNNVDIPAERFRIVGRPQVAEINPAATRTDTTAIPQIVYMPTWRGFFDDTQFSSLDRADKVLEAILSRPDPVNILFKPHPLSYKDPDWPDFKRRIEKVFSTTRPNGAKGQFSLSEASPFDLYNQADLLICDISSVMIDFLYANKPFLTILPQGFKEADQSNFPSLNASYQVQSNLNDLTTQLNEALGDDPLRSSRERIQAYAFGDLDQEPGEAFRTACRALVNDPLTDGGADHE